MRRNDCFANYCRSQAPIEPILEWKKVKKFKTGMSTSSSTKEEEIEDQAQEGKKRKLSARELCTVACAVRFHRRFGFP